MAKAREIIETVGIDDRVSRRQLHCSAVVIDNDGIQTKPLGLGKRSERCRTAVDGDQKGGALACQSGDRLVIRAVAFGNTVGDMYQGIEARGAEKGAKQRGRGCAVDIVVAEDGDALAFCDRPLQSLDCRIHVRECARIRKQIAQGRLQEPRAGLGRDTPAGQHTGDKVGHAMALHHSQRLPTAALVEPLMPWLAEQRPLHTQERRPHGLILCRALAPTSTRLHVSALFAH